MTMADSERESVNSDTREKVLQGCGYQRNSLRLSSLSVSDISGTGGNRVFVAPRMKIALDTYDSGNREKITKSRSAQTLD
jgi:hypothetical protein